MLADACKQSRRCERSARWRHRCAGWPEEHDDRGYALRSRSSRLCLNGWNSRPGYRSRGGAEDQELTRRRWALRSLAWRRKTRRSAYRRIMKAVRRSLRAWVNLHLDILVDRMRREFSVEADVGAPQVAYRETITRRAKSITPTRSRRVVLVSTRGSSLFSSRRKTSRSVTRSTHDRWRSVPKEYIPGVEKGLKSAMESGIIVGFP